MARRPVVEFDHFAHRSLSESDEAWRDLRERCPVAYLPLGTLEWHGLHNPVGLDALKAHALAVRCARSGGGVGGNGL